MGTELVSASAGAWPCQRLHGGLCGRIGRGSPGARLKQANFEQIRQEAVNAGFITNEEVDQVLILLDDPDFAISSHMMFTSWGRRP
jgi:hypothetical protein